VRALFDFAADLLETTVLDRPGLWRKVRTALSLVRDAGPSLELAVRRDRSALPIAIARWLVAALRRWEDELRKIM
jgi:hypothetical protein